MEKEVVYVEEEFLITKNKITSYADFLVRSIDRYVDYMWYAGIKEGRISDKLVELRENIAAYREYIATECDNVLGHAGKAISDIQEVDDFAFPDDMTLSIRSILSELL